MLESRRVVGLVAKLESIEATFPLKAFPELKFFSIGFREHLISRSHLNPYFVFFSSDFCFTLFFLKQHDTLNVFHTLQKSILCPTKNNGLDQFSVKRN